MGWALPDKEGVTLRGLPHRWVDCRICDVLVPQVRSLPVGGRCGRTSIGGSQGQICAPAPQLSRVVASHHPMGAVSAGALVFTCYLGGHSEESDRPPYLPTSPMYL